MRALFRQEKIQGSLKRLENIVATKPFQDALQNLADNRDELSVAENDPNDYFAGFGVVIPKGFNIEITRENAKDEKEKASRKAATTSIALMIRICVSWCTNDGCYFYCVTFEF